MNELHDFDWVADETEQAPARPKRSLGAIVGISVVFGGGGLAALALIIAAIARASSGVDVAQPTRSSTALPAPAVTQSAAPATTGPLPAGCGGLYSEAMSQTLSQLGFELGSGFEGDALPATTDAELREAIGDPDLDCYWWDGTTGLLTQITAVGEQQQSIAISRLETLGFTEVSEHGGVRYFIERSSATGASGESHFFRDGLWFATHWIGHGQYGYTADMVRSVFSE